MRLSASTYSFEAIPLEGTLAVCKSMGFKAVDIAGFHARGRASYEPDDVGANPQKFADRLNVLLDKYELEALDFFPQFGANPNERSMNDPDPTILKQNVQSFRGIVQFCKLTGMHNVTVLPGIDHPERPHAQNLDESAKALSLLVDIAGEAGIGITFEPHMASVAQTPEVALELLERVPGVKFTLDYSHYVLQYIPVERVHPMIPHAGHVHIRQAKPGKLQTAYSAGTIDFIDIIQRLKAAGYDGAVSVEYVCADWFGANEIDTLTETAVTKAALEPYVSL